MKRTRSPERDVEGKGRKDGSKFGAMLGSFRKAKAQPIASSAAAPAPLARPVLGGVAPGMLGRRRAEVRAKTVWSFWHEGEDRLPPFYVLCVSSWRARLGPAWDVRVLNLLRDHPDNALAFLEPGDLPNRFHDIRLPQHQVNCFRRFMRS